MQNFVGNPYAQNSYPMVNPQPQQSIVNSQPGVNFPPMNSMNGNQMGFNPQQFNPGMFSPQPVVPMQPMMRSRPVTSKEEAMAIPVDFDGSTLVMPDTAHGFIYTKVFNPSDRSAIFDEYQKVQKNLNTPIDQPQVSSSIPEETVKNLEDRLSSLIDNKFNVIENKVMGIFSNMQSFIPPVPVEPIVATPAPASKSSTAQKGSASK